MSLSVCCFSRDPGDRVHAILSLLRPVADEIVVAADSQVDGADLEAYGAIADKLLRFRHDGTQRHHAWLHDQCSGDWVFRIDGDEVPSAALIEQLPELTSRIDVLQCWLPTRWLFPDRMRWLDELPWWPDYHNRLLLKTAALRFSGKPHTGAVPAEPARYLEAPLYHLDAILNSVEARKAKIRKYAALRPEMVVAAGGTIGSYYLPERRPAPRLAPVPPEDLALIEQVLAASDGAFEGVADVPLASDRDIVRHWSGRSLDTDAYRASITPFERDWRMQPGEARHVFFAVHNEGNERWPRGLDEPPLIRVGHRWLDAELRVVVSDTPRAGFPAPVVPQETCIVPVTVTAPESSGEYVLEVDLVHEFERWFGCEVRVPVSILDRAGVRKPEAPRQRLLPRLRAPVVRRRVACLGSEAAFEATRRALAAHGVPIARVPARPRGIVLAGGTPIGRADVRLEIERAVDADPELGLFMLGPAVEDPDFHESERPALLDELSRWGELLRRFERPSVRGERSRELLAGLGVDTDVVGDPALLVSEHVTVPADPRLVGVNLGAVGRIWGGDLELLLDQVAAFGRAMAGRGRRIRFVSIGERDLPLVEEAARRLGTRAEVLAPAGLDRTLRAIGECGVFVGQRVQAVVLSAGLSVPSVMLAYHPKCAEVHESVGQEEFTLRTDTLLVDDLVERVDELSSARERHCERLAEHVTILRGRLHRELDAVRTDLERPTDDAALLSPSRQPD